MQCKPRLIISVPNSGTTWLGAILGKYLGPYHDEYFNPILNQPHESKLGLCFGSELVAYYRNIASGSSDVVDEVIQATWFAEPEPLGFTKEVFSPFKLASFAKRFRCVVLHRPAFGDDGVFPPSRARVWSFYEHAWWALKESGQHQLQATTIKHRAHEAHEIMIDALLGDAAELRVPVLTRRMLFAPAEELAQTLTRAFGAFDGSADCAIEIARTRERKAWRDQQS